MTQWWAANKNSNLGVHQVYTLLQKKATNNTKRHCDLLVQQYLSNLVLSNTLFLIEQTLNKKPLLLLVHGQNKRERERERYWAVCMITVHHCMAILR
jgi:hypothetical protein